MTIGTPPEQTIVVNETTTTLTIELVGVCIAIAAGFVHLLEAWPSPVVPVVWMCAVFVLFSGYRVGSFVRQKYFPPPEPEIAEQQDRAQAGRGKMLSLKWSAVEPNQPTTSSKDKAPAGPLEIPGVDGDFSASEMATMGLPQIALGEASDDPTAFLDEEALRPETDEDISRPDEGSIPMFAESTMSIDERTLAMQAIEIGDSDADSEGPTAPLDQVAVLDEAAERTEAIDADSIGHAPAQDGPTIAMKAVSEEPESQKTQALDQDALYDADADADGVAKTQKNPAVKSARKPFSNRSETSGPMQPRSRQQRPNRERTESEPVQPSSDGVQVLDAEKLRRMQRELEKQEKGED